MTPTREQVIDMSIASGLNDRLRLDSEAGRILSVQCLERFATLAMSAGRDQGLREAKEVCEQVETESQTTIFLGATDEYLDGRAMGANVCAGLIEQLRGK